MITKKPVDWEFLGYGDLSAPIWMIGIEEYCSDDTDAARRLPHISNFPSNVDVLEAHLNYGMTVQAYEESESKVEVWRVATEIEKHCGVSNSIPPGRKGSRVFMAELGPLPCPGIGKWPAPYHRFYPSKARYKKDVYGARAGRLIRAVNTHKPKLVVVHGAAMRKWFSAHLLDSKRSILMERGKGAFGYVPTEVVACEISADTIWCSCANFGGAAAWSPRAKSRLAEILGNAFTNGI